MHSTNERLDLCLNGDFHQLGQLTKMELGALCMVGISPVGLTCSQDTLFACLQYSLLLEQFDVAQQILETDIDWRADNYRLIRMLSGERHYATIAALIDECDLHVLEPHVRKKVMTFREHTVRYYSSI